MGNFNAEYWVNQGGDNLGPYSFSQIEQKFDKGEIGSGELVCVVGADVWSSIEEVLGLDIQTKDFEDGFVDRPKIIMKKSSGITLNKILSGVLFFLLLVFCGLYLFVQLRKSNPNTLEFSELYNPGTDNIEEVIKLAVSESLLIEEDGLLVMKDSNSSFTGWAKRLFLVGDILSSLVQYREGKAIFGYSWSAKGVRSEETTLQEGTGQIVYFFEGAGKRMESVYRSGLLNGVRTRWHENGEKAVEESWNNGRLNGQRLVWDKNGQKVEQVFYLNNLKNGPFSYWSKNGQKYEEGTYNNGVLDGKRIQWSRDGSDRFEEFYENGKLIPLDPIEVAVMAKDALADPDAGPVLAKLLKLAGKDEDWARKARATNEVVNFIFDRFKQSQIPGHEIFNDLATSLFEFAKQGGGKEKMVVSSLDWIRNQWGIDIFFNEQGFALRELPESVSLGPITWQSVDYAQDFLGSLQGDSRDLVVGDLQNLFQAVGVELGEETETIQNKVEVQIWDQFELQAEDAGSANLELKGGELVFTAIESKKIKKIDNGNSIFETIESEILYTISQQRSQGKKVGPFFKVLDEAKVKFQESMNGTLMIRKYTDLVIISDQLSAEGKTLLYPNVTIQFAGLAPMGENTTIRFTKVELGEFLEAPEPINGDNDIPL